MTARTIVVVALSLFAAMAVALAAGCNIEDFVRVQTPVGLQQSHGLPSSMSLTDAHHEFARVLDHTTRDLNHWRGSIEDSSRFAAVLRQLTLANLAEFGPQLAGIPLLGPAIPLATGLAGLFLRRRGDRSPDEVRKEKESSHNHGLEAGVQHTLDALRVMGVAVPANAAGQIVGALASTTGPPPPGGGSGPSEGTPTHAGERRP